MSEAERTRVRFFIRVFLSLSLSPFYHLFVYSSQSVKYSLYTLSSCFNTLLSFLVFIISLLVKLFHSFCSSIFFLLLFLLQFPNRQYKSFCVCFFSYIFEMSGRFSLFLRLLTRFIQTHTHTNISPSYRVNRADVAFKCVAYTYSLSTYALRYV